MLTVFKCKLRTLKNLSGNGFCGFLAPSESVQALNERVRETFVQVCHE